MSQTFGEVMFGDASKRLQERYGSRAQYGRLAAIGPRSDGLGGFEAEFIAEGDSFYMSSVTADGWPYVQHRGGPPGFLKVLAPHTLAFADFAGNRQYVSAGNFETNDRMALFLMSYPEQARLKVIGHARVVEAGVDPALEARVLLPGYRAKVERIVTIEVVAFDWNCSQHITPRWTQADVEAAMVSRKAE